MSFCVPTFFTKIMVGYFLYFKQGTCLTHLNLLRQPPELYLKRVQIKFSLLPVFPLYCRFVPLRPKYLPYNSVAENGLCSKCDRTVSHRYKTEENLLGIAALSSCNSKL
jgi:hypothetical protein